MAKQIRWKEQNSQLTNLSYFISRMTNMNAFRRDAQGISKILSGFYPKLSTLASKTA